MNTLYNLPMNNPELKESLEKLNQLVIADGDLAQHVLQWIVNNSTEKDLSFLIKSVERHLM